VPLRDPRPLAGLFLLLAPRIVSFAVAVYLIFVGLLGLNLSHRQITGALTRCECCFG
jgi:hypothetical protein